MVVESEAFVDASALILKGVPEGAPSKLNILRGALGGKVPENLFSESGPKKKAVPPQPCFSGYVTHTTLSASYQTRRV